MDNINCQLWTALVTPLDDKLNVDYNSLDKLITMQAEAKNGILVLGSTGESLNLSLNEKKEILNYICNKNLEIPIMVGIGGFNLPETLEWIDYLNTLQIHCYLSVTPIYSKPGVIGQTNWFKNILDRSDKPVMLYNIPCRSGIKLHKQTLKNLIGHKNLWAVKEASGSIQDFIEYTQIDKSLKIYSGDDAMLPHYAMLGAAGLISVASNIWPKETNLYTKKALGNKLSENEIIMWQKSSDTLFWASNPIPVKSLLSQLKIISTPNLKAPLDSSDLEDTDKLLWANQQITNWFKEN